MVIRLYLILRSCPELANVFLLPTTIFDACTVSVAKLQALYIICWIFSRISLLSSHSASEFCYLLLLVNSTCFWFRLRPLRPFRSSWETPCRTWKTINSSQWSPNVCCISPFARKKNNVDFWWFLLPKIHLILVDSHPHDPCTPFTTGFSYVESYFFTLDHTVLSSTPMFHSRAEHILATPFAMLRNLWLRSSISLISGGAISGKNFMVNNG